MSAYPITVHPHWCLVCQQRPVAHRDDACPGCLGVLDNDVDPITRWPKTMPRPSRWQRVWARLERRRSA